MKEITVGFNKGFGYTFLISGILLLIAQIALFAITQKGTSLITMVTSIFVIIVGIRYLNGNYFKLGSTDIKLYNLFGTAVKTYHFDDLDSLNYIDNKVFIEKDGKTKRVRLSKMMSNKEHWSQFISEITKNDYSRQLHELP